MKLVDIGQELSAVDGGEVDLHDAKLLEGDSLQEPRWAIHVNPGHVVAVKVPVLGSGETAADRALVVTTKGEFKVACNPSALRNNLGRAAGS